MATTYDRYFDGVKTKYNLFAQWPVNSLIKLGHVGYVKNRLFEPVTTLEELGIKFESEDSDSPADYDHASDAEVSFSANAGGTALTEAKANALVKLGGKGSFLFQATGCVETSIKGRQKLEADILALQGQKKWKEGWVVVDKIYRADMTTVIISEADSSEVEIKAEGKIAHGPLALADAAAGLSAGNTRGSVTKFVAVPGIVPLFSLAGLRKKYWNVIGAAELRATRGGLEAEPVAAGDAGEAGFTLEPASEPTWRALVIGIDSYPAFLSESPQRQLEGCVNDARAFKRFLVDRVQVKESNIGYLDAPQGDVRPNDDANKATAASIRAAMATLLAAVEPGDHVVVFYAAHGVRLERKGGAERFYGLVPHDVKRKGDGFENLILGHEINGFLRALTEKKHASVTVIADTCHSGSSTRGIDAAKGQTRSLPAASLGEAEWAELLKAHPVPAGGDASANGTRGLGAKAGFFDVDQNNDWVILSACQDIEEAHEASGRVAMDASGEEPLSHGVLTLTLLSELEKVPDAAVRTHRWLDFYDALSAAVASSYPNQRPILGGQREKSVFGGAWTPFDPGFTVRVGASSEITVDGGKIQGLDDGAEILIYPPETPDFEKADESKVPTVRAVIEKATHFTSTARRLDGAGGAATAVANGSRARLVKPSPATEPMLVRAAEGVMSSAMRDAALAVPDAKSFFTLVTRADEPAHVELQPWSHEVPVGVWDGKPAWSGAKGGWVLVPSDARGAPSKRLESSAAVDDAIAYLPTSPTRADGLSASKKEAALGDALGRALVHYGNYLRGRDRQGGDASLRSMLDVRLRVGSGEVPKRSTAVGEMETWLDKNSTYLDPVDGVFEITSAQWIHVEIRVLRATSLRLYLGVVGFYDEGDVSSYWPTQGDRPTLENGTLLRVGNAKSRPLRITPRVDLQRCSWTLKVIAYTASADADAINLQSLAQRPTQRVIRAQLEPIDPSGRGGGDPSDDAPRDPPDSPASYTWNLRIRVSNPAVAPG
jgi:hypothetical protein